MCDEDVPFRSVLTSLGWKPTTLEKFNVEDVWQEAPRIPPVFFAIFNTNIFPYDTSDGYTNIDDAMKAPGVRIILCTMGSVLKGAFAVVEQLWREPLHRRSYSGALMPQILALALHLDNVGITTPILQARVNISGDEEYTVLTPRDGKTFEQSKTTVSVDYALHMLRTQPILFLNLHEWMEIIVDHSAVFLRRLQKDQSEPRGLEIWSIVLQNAFRLVKDIDSLLPMVETGNSLYPGVLDVTYERMVNAGGLLKRTLARPHELEQAIKVLRFHLQEGLLDASPMARSELDATLTAIRPRIGTYAVSMLRKELADYELEHEKWLGSKRYAWLSAVIQGGVLREAERENLVAAQKRARRS